MQKNKIQKILALGSIVSVMALMGAGPALADLETVNENTGFNSTNDVVATLNESFVSVNSNVEAVVNVADGTVSTGGNIVGNNTSGGEAITGFVSLDGQFMNDTNINTLDFSSSVLGDPLSENNTTGADSTNNATTTLAEAIVATNTNGASVGNTMFVTAVSGNNDIENNTGPGIVGTGDVDGLLTTSNLVNSNFLDLMLGGGELMSVALNDTTGWNSTNDAVVDIDSSVVAVNVNTADIVNLALSTLSSGGNIVSNNTGSVDVTTGSVSGTTDIINEVNSNSTSVGLSANAEINASNTNTGATSTNGAAASITETATVVNVNTADITNIVDTTTTSGGNEASGNTGAVTMSTGDANNSVLVDNGSTANVNTTDITLNTEGVVIGASNDTTGWNSDNQTDATLDMTVVATNANDMAITNVVDASSYTGGNTVDNNTGATDVTTGEASSDVTVVNDVNNNTTNVTMNPTGIISAGNSTTGADSTNGAAATADSTVIVVNTNDADITNVVNVVTSSGGNDVSGNTGASSVSTGGAALNFSVENSGNSNTTNVGE